MTFRKFKIYAKLTGISLVLLIAVLFMFNNREPVSVNFLVWKTQETPKYRFMLYTAAMSILTFYVAGSIRRTWSEYRQIRREEKARVQLVNEVKNNVREEENSQEGAV